jgi:16S rRNA (guanine527-N7)-methyltransferase
VDRRHKKTATASGAGSRLNLLLEESGLAPLDAMIAGKFEEYVSLILRWSAKVNLTSIRSEEGILTRHILESIACAHALPAGIGTLLDYGSGAGFPGLPIALCRAEIAVTLAESQGKKAAFLREAVRVLGVVAKVHAQRAESLGRRFDCVTLRAVDRMQDAVSAGAQCVAPSGWLGLMTTDRDLERLKEAAGTQFTWSDPIRLPGSESRVLALGHFL